MAVLVLVDDIDSGDDLIHPSGRSLRAGAIVVASGGLIRPEGFAKQEGDPIHRIRSVVLSPEVVPSDRQAVLGRGGVVVLTERDSLRSVARVLGVGRGAREALVGRGRRKGVDCGDGLVGAPGATCDRVEGVGRRGRVVIRLDDPSDGSNAVGCGDCLVTLVGKRDGVHRLEGDPLEARRQRSLGPGQAIQRIEQQGVGGRRFVGDRHVGSVPRTLLDVGDRVVQVRARGVLPLHAERGAVPVPQRGIALIGATQPEAVSCLVESAPELVVGLRGRGPDRSVPSRP